MSRPQHGLRLLGAVFLLTTGCTASPWTSPAAPGPAGTAPLAAGAAGLGQLPAGQLPAGQLPAGQLPAGQLPAGPPMQQPDPRAVEAFVNQIAEIERLDPASRDRLAHDLRQTDPALWPLLTQVFRAALAYRRQGDERVGVAPGAEVPPPPELPSEAASPRPSALVDRREAKPPPDVAREARGTRDAAKPAPDAAKAIGAAPGSAVVPASYIASPAEGWRDRLAAAVAALEGELHQMPRTPVEMDLQARLRLLYLTANRRDDALRPIASAVPAVQEFWSQELYGLATWLDADRISDTASRANEAKRQLGGAAQRLGEIAPLSIRNLSFLSEVESYGNITPFEKRTFAPNQEVVLYAEVENFKSEETVKGFHTVLSGNYQILDGRGQRVAGQELKTIEDLCRNPRRDFFVRYTLFIPKQLNPGKYTLQLTLEDAKAQKVAQSSIDFTMREPGK